MNIYLVGYRGTGKTTIGKILAKKLNKTFVDTDELIENRKRKKIEQIFRENGEEYFRKIEHLILKEISSLKNQIVSTGGGIVIKEENRKIIKESGITIYLKADKETIYNRIKFDKNRPSLTDKDPLSEIEYLLEKRKPYYEEIADIEIDTSKTSINDSVNEIINRLKEFKYEDNI